MTDDVDNRDNPDRWHLLGEQIDRAQKNEVLCDWCEQYYDFNDGQFCDFCERHICPACTAPVLDPITNFERKYVCAGCRERIADIAVGLELLAKKAKE